MYRGSAEGKSAHTLLRTTIFFAIIGVMLLGYFVPLAEADEVEVQGASVVATWNCTGTPCPWGAQTANHAAVWPAVAEPTRARHGYTVTHDVYAAGSKVAGWKLTVT
ncbi:MAG TPA: hypothetical protein VLJ88_10495, partial [Propionibacteriaceae bacterium]|nr:hypothetical protein [Propionibacteriaceae bacterium]